MHNQRQPTEKMEIMKIMDKRRGRRILQDVGRIEPEIESEFSVVELRSCGDETQLEQKSMN